MKKSESIMQKLKNRKMMLFKENEEKFQQIINERKAQLQLQKLMENNESFEAK